MPDNIYRYKGRPVYQVSWLPHQFDREPFTLPYHIWGFKTALSKSHRIVWDSGFAALIIPAGTRMICPTYEKAMNPDWGIRYGGMNSERKTRAELAYVVATTDGIGIRVPSLTAKYSPTFQYKAGQIVRPVYPFDTDPIACSSGIHFFTTIRRAVWHTCNTPPGTTSRISERLAEILKLSTRFE